MKILICGDRKWTNSKLIKDRMLRIPPGSCIIHGAADGADNIANNIARDLGFEVMSFPAEWHKFNKAAGMMRNIQMLDEKPDLVIAFHNNIAESKGTKHCVNEANRRDIPVELHSETPLTQ